MFVLLCFMYGLLGVCVFSGLFGFTCVGLLACELLCLDTCLSWLRCGFALAWVLLLEG